MARYARLLFVAATGSDLEETLAWQMRVAKLPIPEREVVFAKDIGRRWRLDFLFREQMLAVEVEGKTYANGRHNRGPGFHEDCYKYAELAIRGFRLIRLDSKMVDDGSGLALVERALAWSPACEEAA